MKLFKRYLFYKRKLFILFFAFSLFFYVSFSLYHLPVSAVLYPVCVCIFASAVYILADFRTVRKKHHMLDRLKKLSASEIEDFPPPDSISDDDYREAVLSLKKEIAGSEAASDKKYSDMMDYYTVWVHQIKTPIASMKLILENMDSQDSRKLSAELFRIEQYVGMVLTYLRLDTSATDYVFSETNLDDIIRQSIKSFAGEFILRKLRLDYSPVQKTVLTDEKWLSFVIGQIVSNALKYTFEGSIRIYMKDDKTLCIKDSGIGISPEDLPRIFENGYTGHNGRNDKKASGIGLYLCKCICDRLGHTISAESKPGEGTAVSIYFDRYDLKAE